MSNWSQPFEGDLKCPPSLDPQLEYFLEGEMPLLGAEGGDSYWQELTPEPFLNNSSEWVTWRANHINTLTWWLELSAVPGERDVEEFTQKVWALFELPQRRSHVQDTTDNYSAPPPSSP